MTKFSVPSLEAVTAPIVAAGKLSVAQLEKLTSFQFALVQDYAELSLSRLKAATEISDLAGLKAYGEASVGVAKPKTMLPRTARIIRASGKKDPNSILNTSRRTKVKIA